MGGYNKFNVMFCINGVEFVDCRAFLKLGNWMYKRIGSDEYNNCDILLDADAVEGHALREGVEYQDLITEEEMNNEFMSMFQNGSWQRIGGNELNNVQKAMTETEVESIALSLNVPFSSLKTEIETMQDIHLPDDVVISEFESFKIQNQFIAFAKVSNIKASQLVPKTEFSKFDILKEDGTQKKWKEFLEFLQKSGGYFLKIVMDSEADFKLFYNYFIPTYQVLTASEYENFQ